MLPLASAADGVDADTAHKPDTVNVSSVDSVREDDVVFGYSRRQALADGVLVDVTRQASPAEMHGGFLVPVAVTGALWATIEAIPPSLDGLADPRGRLHEILWMASLAVRRASAMFAIHLPTAGTRQRTRRLRVEVGPDDDGMPCVTIGFPEDF
jgi:hypothetical protein